MDIARSFTDQIDMAYTTVSFYMGMHIFLSIFNLVAGYRILQTINKQSKTKDRLRMIIRRIIYSGFATMFGLLILTISITPANQYPFGVAILWSLLQISFFLQSLLLITIFQVPKKKKARSSTTKKSLTDSTSASASASASTTNTKENL